MQNKKTLKNTEKLWRTPESHKTPKSPEKPLRTLIRPDEPGRILEDHLSPEDPSSHPGLHSRRPECVPMASNEDVGVQLNVIQGLETLPLLPMFLAQPEIARLQMLPMRLPRRSTAPWHLASADRAQWPPYLLQPFLAFG